MDWRKGRKMDEQIAETSGTEQPTEPDATPNGEPTREQILDALRNVYDPELGISIVDLGLVYDVEVKDGVVHVEYVLTTMGCPIGPLIEQQMGYVLASVPGVKATDIEMVLSPPWSPEMMSEEAKSALGYF